MNNPEKSPAERISAAFKTRYGSALGMPDQQPGAAELARMAEHRSLRRYRPDPVSPELLRLLFACALSAPTKSDLQQADIIHVADPEKRRRIAYNAVLERTVRRRMQQPRAIARPRRAERDQLLRQLKIEHIDAH